MIVCLRMPSLLLCLSHLLVGGSQSTPFLGLCNLTAAKLLARRLGLAITRAGCRTVTVSMHLRAPPGSQKPAQKPAAAPAPPPLLEEEADLRYAAALHTAFPCGKLAESAPKVWAFCEDAGKALSSHPGAIYMALHSLASFEMPNVVAKYTSLLDIPSVTWKLQLGKTGDGKSLVINFVKEVLKQRRAHVQAHYEAVHKKQVEEWKKERRFEDSAAKPIPPNVKLICDDGSAVVWCHSMSLPENEGRGFVVLHECKKFMQSANNASGAFPATTLCKLWDRDDYSHDVQDYHKEFTLERPLFVIHTAGHLEDKHKCFQFGDELGIDNRLDSFVFPAQINHLADFPLHLDKAAIYGAAAEVFRAMWEHFHSEAVQPLIEAFTGFLRIPVAEAHDFATWYDELVDQQLVAATSGNASHAGFLSKKKTKILRYALPHTFLEQFFARQAAVAESVPVPEVRNSIGVSDLRVSVSVLDFLEAQRPHLNTLSGRIYACQEPAAAELASVADCGGLVLQEVCAIEPSKLPEIVATDTAAFVTALFSLCSSKKPVMPLKEIQATWATLDPEQGRRVAKMQNAALSTLSCFQAILVRDNVRGPKITKLCRFPVERHLNAPGTETVTAFNTHFACTTLINSCAQTPIVLSWPTGPNVLTQLSSAGVPESALQTSDAKVATALPQSSACAPRRPAAWCTLARRLCSWCGQLSCHNQATADGCSASSKCCWWLASSHASRRHAGCFWGLKVFH